MRVKGRGALAGQGAPPGVIQLGLRANWRQFALLVLVNAFVGGMVGLERTVVPLIGAEEFQLASTTLVTSFIVSFGIVKACANLVAGQLADMYGRKRVLVLGWLVGLPVPFLIMLAPSWDWIVAANALLGINQGLAWSMTVPMKIDLVGPSRRGLAMGLNEAAGYGASGASELADVLAAAAYLRTRPDVDPARIGLWGGSYGGYLTAMGLAHASDLFAAGVDMHGVHDWNVGIRTFVPSYNPLESPEEARRAFEASPMAAVDRWRSPVLVIHGDDDRNVSFSETVRLVEALRARGVEVEQLVFPDEVHSFLRHANWLAAYRAAADFFDRRLGRPAAARR